MLQKMYLDNVEKSRDFSAQGGFAEGVKSKKLDFQFYWRALTKHKWPIGLFTALVAAGAIYYAQIATPIYAANATLLLESQKANIVSIEDLVSSEQDSLDYYGTQIALLRSRALAQRVINQLELQENISQAQFAEMLSPSTLGILIDSVIEPVATASNSLLRMVGLGGSATSNDEAYFPGTATDDHELAGPMVETLAVEDAELNEILKKFSDSLRVNPMAKTKLVSIIFESTDPEFSALVANAVATQYIESVIARRKAIKDVASEWMDGRITTLKERLNQSEDALLSFKLENGLVEIDGGVGRLNEQELLLTSTELAEARNELSNASDLNRKIQGFRGSAPQMLETLPFVQNDPLVRSVKSELGQAQRDLNELRNRYGAKHPTIVDAESRLDSLRSTLGGHIDRAISTFENDFQLLQQRVASLEASIVQGKENIQFIGQKQVTLEALEREVAANRDQYNRMFDRLTETRITDGLDEANAVLSQPAWVQTHPIKPNKILLVALAIVGALMLSAFICFLIEFADDTISSIEDIEKRLKTKLLGVLPLTERGFMGKKKALPLTPLEVIENSETFTEAVNTCRTALLNRHAFDLQVILVTSSIPDEGKSTVALNLAYSFGQLGRTLLIDCDLRRPSVAKALDLPPIAFGLSSVLLEKTTVENCIRRDVLESFDCLTSGPIPDQPLEMLSSARFAKVMEHLKQHYDTIIIDSAPTHAVSDALILSKFADSVLYVVKPYDTSIKLIHSGLSRLAEASDSAIGVCLSQVDVKKSNAYGGMEFHGFGIDYNGYGKYYTYNDKPRRRSKNRLRAKAKKKQSDAKVRFGEKKVILSSDNHLAQKMEMAQHG